jgi:hypothetical protein
MGKIVKGILLGATVGAGIRVAQDLRSEDDLGAIAPRVAKTAGEAALAGATVGVLLTARDRRRAKKMRKSLKGAAKLRSYAETGIAVAVPALQHAAEAARPRVEHAVDVARPHVEAYAKEARKRANTAATKAKPRVEAAAKEARERAGTVVDLATESAKRRIADMDLPAAFIAV